MGEAKNPRGD